MLNYTDLPEITLEQIQHFFAHYKDLEPGKWVKIAGWGDAAEARSLIEAFNGPREPPRRITRALTVVCEGRLPADL